MTRLIPSSREPLAKTTQESCCSNVIDYFYINFHACLISIYRFLRVAVFLLIVVYVIVDVAIEHPKNLISVAGLVLCILVFYITSINPAKVCERHQNVGREKHF